MNTRLQPWKDVLQRTRKSTGRDITEFWQALKDLGVNIELRQYRRLENGTGDPSAQTALELLKALRTMQGTDFEALIAELSPLKVPLVTSPHRFALDEYHYALLLKSSLIRHPQRNRAQLKECLRLGVEARELECIEGKFQSALRSYAAALQATNQLQEPLLAIYLKIHLAHITEMVGDLRRAEQLLGEVRDELQREETLVASGKNPEELRLIRVLGARADITLLWVRLIESDLNTVIDPYTGAPALIARLHLLEDDIGLLELHQLLSRAYKDLEQYDAALEHVRLLLRRSNGVYMPLYQRSDLLFDNPASLGLVHRLNKGYAAAFDLAVRTGDIKSAASNLELMSPLVKPLQGVYYKHLMEYQWLMHVEKHNLPERNQTITVAPTDVLFEQWNRGVADTANSHIRAHVTLGYARFLRQSNRLREAIFFGRKALEIAKARNAKTLIVESGLELSSVYMAQSEPALARSQLYMVLPHIERLRVSGYQERYTTIQEAVHELGTAS